MSTVNHNITLQCIKANTFLSTTQLFLFLFTLFVDFSFSILVDINRLVRIVQFMHAVCSVWVPEAIPFFIYQFLQRQLHSICSLSACIDESES